MTIFGLYKSNALAVSTLSSLLLRLHVATFLVPTSLFSLLLLQISALCDASSASNSKYIILRVRISNTISFYWTASWLEHQIVLQQDPLYNSSWLWYILIHLFHCGAVPGDGPQDKISSPTWNYIRIWVHDHSRSIMPATAIGNLTHHL